MYAVGLSPIDNFSGTKVKNTNLDVSVSRPNRQRIERRHIDGIKGKDHLDLELGVSPDPKFQRKSHVSREVVSD